MRIALAQLNYKIGDFENNFAKIAQVIEQQQGKADLIVFSELCLSGYYPKDLIYQPGFMAAQNRILQKLQPLTATKKIAIIIGFIASNQGKGQPFHNSLCLINQGNIEYTYHKKLLPVYNIFNEARHFAPGRQAGIYEFQQHRFGFLICEDGWANLGGYLYECNPVDELAQHKLDAIICINGSPSHVGKQTERIQHFSAIAKRCQAPLLFTNQVGGNDDIVYDGGSFILDQQGDIVGILKNFAPDTGIITLENKTISSLTHFSAYQPLTEEAFFYQQMLLGLQDYVAKCRFKKVVIGLSGGIDSALTLALAVKALGAENVIALAMPSPYSSPASLEDAKSLCQIFSVKLYCIPITEEFKLCLRQFTETYGELPAPLTEQNIQARLRGRLLMEYSNQTGALVLSTGNKSELSVGYTTLYGDMTGGFNLIGDLYKTEVYKVAHYFNQIHPQSRIPKNIFQKAPSAELSPHQKDSDSLPEYEILDPILKLYIEGDLLNPAEKEACQALVNQLPSSLTVQIHNMVDKAEFKRRQAPPIIRLQRRAFGYGRQLPIAATYPSS